VKALTLWQPWATLIALGEKHYETRHWVTPYRGPLVIHAAARKVRPDELNLQILDTLGAHGLEIDDLPLGAGLCVVNMTKVWNTTTLVTFAGLDIKERSFGNYTPGRYAWQLDNLRVFPQPIPAKGEQGLWEWRLPLEITS